MPSVEQYILGIDIFRCCIAGISNNFDFSHPASNPEPDNGLFIMGQIRSVLNNFITTAFPQTTNFQI